MHWCRCRVRFNEVPEKVPKVPEKVGEAFVQPGQVQPGSGEGSGEGLGGFGAKPGQVQQGSEGSEALVLQRIVRPTHSKDDTHKSRCNSCVTFMYLSWKLMIQVDFIEALFGTKASACVSH